MNDVSLYGGKIRLILDLQGLKIYNGDSEIVKLSKDDTFYKISGLEANKNYNFKFVSMYGSKDSGVVQKGVKNSY
ncbi:hypothetical protein ACT7DD_15280 [Bacillus paranthracis]